MPDELDNIPNQKELDGNSINKLSTWWKYICKFGKWGLDNRGGELFAHHENRRTYTSSKTKSTDKSKPRILAFDPIEGKYVPKDELIKKYGEEIPVRKRIDKQPAESSHRYEKIIRKPQSKKSSFRRIWIPQAIAVVMLLWALNPENPYGYYVLLRFVCCAVFVYLAIEALNQKKEGCVWVFGVTAVIYNPLIRIHLTREIWSVVNIVTIILAIYSTFILKAGSK
jgi:hypothetical protein